MTQSAEIQISGAALYRALSKAKVGRSKADSAEIRPAFGGVTIFVETAMGAGELSIPCKGEWPQAVRVNYATLKHIARSYAPNPIRLRVLDGQVGINQTRISASLVSSGRVACPPAYGQLDLLDLLAKLQKPESQQKPRRTKRKKPKAKQAVDQFNLPLAPRRDSFRYRNRWALKGNSLYRLQALNALPALKKLLPKLEVQIDSGEPLMPAIASIVGVSTGTVRWFGSLSHDAHKRVSLIPADEISPFIQNIDKVPIEWRPQTASDIAIAYEAFGILHDVAAVLGVPFKTAVLRSKGQWSKVSGEYLPALNSDFLCTVERDQIWGQVYDFWRVVYAVEVLRQIKAKGVEITKAVISEAASIDSAVRREIADILYGELSPQRALQLMGSWARTMGDPFGHPAAEAYELDRTLQKIGATRPVFRDPIYVPNGLWVVPVYSADMLLEEAARMENCIAKYPNRIRYMPAHIISIRTRADESLATVLLEETGNGFVVSDFQGPRNTKPHYSCELALKWLLKEVASGAINVDMEQIRLERQERRRKAGGWNEACDRLGFHIFDGAVVEWVYRAFHSMFMPSKFRELSRMEMLAETGLLRSIEQRAKIIRRMDFGERQPNQQSFRSDWFDRI